MAKRKLAEVSTDALKKELERRQSNMGQLKARRDKLAKELAELDKQLGDLGGATGGGGGGGAAAAPKNGRRRGGGGRKKAGSMAAAAGGAPANGRRRPGRPRKNAAGSPAGGGEGGNEGGGGGGGGGRRPRNSMTLIEAMAQVLRGKTMSVSEIADKVQEAGYQTTSSTFRTIVNQTLLKNPGTFEKVSRGQYTAK